MYKIVVVQPVFICESEGFNFAADILLTSLVQCDSLNISNV